MRCCPYCLQNHKKKLFKMESIDFDGSILPLTPNIVECRNCGFIFSDANYTEEVLTKYYENYKYGLSEKSIPHQYSHIFNRKRQISDIIIQHISQNDYLNNMYIYDIGCGHGELLIHLSKKGFKHLFGVEFDDKTLEISTNSYFNTINCNIYNLSLKPQADIIICTHVFEHILDIRKAIKKISENTKENGLLYLEVPNIEAIDNQGLGITTIQAAHINMFSSYHLFNLLQENGFCPLEIVYDKISFNALNTLGIISRKTNKKSDLKIKKTLNSDKLEKKYINCEYKINKELKNFINTEKPIYIWGLGPLIFSLIANSDLRKCNLHYIDKSTKIQKHTINNQKIFSPDIIKEAPTESAVVVGSLMRGDSIISELNELQYKGTIIKDFILI